MASINFRTKGKNTPDATIYVTFRNGRDCILEVKSGITAPSSDWIVKGKVANKRNDADHYIRTNLQKRLDGLRSKISDNLNSTTDYTKEWLQGCVNDFHGIVAPTDNPRLVDYFDKYIDYITHRAKDVRSHNTVKTYVTSRTRIEEFQAYKGKEYRLQDIDLTFQGDFTAWGRNVAKYQEVTFMKTLKQVKTILKFAKKHDKIEVCDEFTHRENSFEVEKSQAKNRPLYLTPEDIDLLMAFKGASFLENARDWLVVSCWTGCRVSDLMNLTSENIHTTITGDKAIRYTQQKTGDRITAPFHPHVAEIVARHNGNFPRPISDQRYNEYIKEVCRMVGMTTMTEGDKFNPEINRKVHGTFPKYELVTSHIGRRSFASNHFGQLPTEAVMLVTGHDTVKQFLEYVGKDPEEHINRFHEFYGMKTPTYTKAKTS